MSLHMNDKLTTRTTLATITIIKIIRIRISSLVEEASYPILVSFAVKIGRMLYTYI